MQPTSLTRKVLRQAEPSRPGFDNHFTVRYSNTARAHELGTNRDWVVIYRDNQNGTGQWTVVTAHYGPLQGKRVVRGREAECERYYAEQAKAPSP